MALWKITASAYALTLLACTPALAQISIESITFPPPPILPNIPVTGGGGPDMGPEPGPPISDAPPPSFDIKFAHRPDLPIPDKDLQALNQQTTAMSGR